MHGPGQSATWRPIEVCSSGYDPDSLGYGTSPEGGVTYPLLPIPIAPTLPGRPDLRYLFRLCTLEVPEGQLAIPRHLRLALRLGAPPPSPIPDAGFAPVYFPVTDSFWHPIDGGVSFALRYETNVIWQLGPNDQRTDEIVQTKFYGDGSALLANPGYVPDFIGTPVSAAYVPPHAGRPFGQAVGDLGEFADLRFPWNDGPEDDALGPPVMGPGKFVLYASVAQTNPRTRPPIVPAQGNLDFLLPEDAFLFLNPLAIYRKIGGAFLADLLDLSCAPALLALARAGAIPARFLALGDLPPPPQAPGTPGPSSVHLLRPRKGTR